VSAYFVNEYMDMDMDCKNSYPICSEQSPNFINFCLMPSDIEHDYVRVVVVLYFIRVGYFTMYMYTFQPINKVL